MDITVEKFKQRMGRDPQDDDLERCNCVDAGTIAHSSCGWNVVYDLPQFVCGPQMHATGSNEVTAHSPFAAELIKHYGPSPAYAKVQP